MHPGPTVLQHFAVIGAGAWGTTFAKVLADAGREVVLWGRRDAIIAEIAADHLNSTYLPGVVLPDGIRATGDLEHALDGADAVVLAIPSQSMRENLAVFRDLVPAAGPVISLAKGWRSAPVCG